METRALARFTLVCLAPWFAACDASPPPRDLLIRSPHDPPLIFFNPEISEDGVGVAIDESWHHNGAPGVHFLTPRHR